jgi:membrane-bound lytic murein transglycosylase D
MRRFTILNILLILINFYGVAQTTPVLPVYDTSETAAIGQNLDKLMNLWYLNHMDMDTSIQNMNIYGFQPGEIPQYTDSIYKYRLCILNSAIPLAYNPYVKSYIEMYTMRKREQVERMLGLAHYYFPKFEQVLDKYNLPLELRNVAVIESALNTHAVSKSGATGLWQFIYSTAKLYKIKITSYVDERRDPDILTETAVIYLKDLYAVYGDWLYVIAAYNCGPGSLNKAIKRSGNQKDIWKVYPYLPVETRGYIPAFIAANYVMAYYKEHNIYPKGYYNPGLLDTVHVYQRLRFDVLSNSLKIPIEQLREINPMYSRDEIPQSVTEKASVLKLPIDKATQFHKYSELIYSYQNYLEQKYRDSLLANTSPPSSYRSDNTVRYKMLSYKVKPGDKIDNIAQWYDCTVNDIKKWNRIKSGNISTGKTLTIYVSNEDYQRYKDVNSMDFAQKQRKVGNNNLVSNTKPVPSESLTATTEVTTTTSPSNQEVVSTPSNPVETAPPDTQTKKLESELFVNKEIKKEYVYYIIKPGDTLWTIAQKYPGVTSTELMQLNNINKSHKLKPGQKIKIKTKS